MTILVCFDHALVVAVQHNRHQFYLEAVVGGRHEAIAVTLEVNLECADRIAVPFDDVFRFAGLCGQWGGRVSRCDKCQYYGK